MFKTTLVVLSMLFLTGCFTTTGRYKKTAEYYMNPNSPGYHEQVLKGHCQSCGRIFTFSAYQAESYESLDCPRCGSEQNLEMACKRYLSAQKEHETILYGLCQSCGRVLSFTAYQLKNYGAFGCPYCGSEQNLRQAYNRYNYAAGQEEEYKKTQALQALIRNIEQAAQRPRYVIPSSLFDYTPPQLPTPSTQERGTSSNPYYIKMKEPIVIKDDYIWGD